MSALEGFISQLWCGHVIVTRGQPEPGDWISCPYCQGQRKVKSSRETE